MGNTLVTFPYALKYEDWFDNYWIPSGLYWHLVDNNNDPHQLWDKVGGFTISEMYNVFSPNIGSVCQFTNELIYKYPFVPVNPTDYKNLLAHYRGLICLG